MSWPRSLTSAPSCRSTRPDRQPANRASAALDRDGGGADEVKRNWDEIKREERSLAERRADPAARQAVPSALDGVQFGQSALALAAQLQRRAAQVGVPEELARLDEEAGPANRLPQVRRPPL